MHLSLLPQLNSDYALSVILIPLSLEIRHLTQAPWTFVVWMLVLFPLGLTA
jgi:hypothetical protein